MNGPVPRPNGQESFYIPPNHVSCAFEGGHGYPNGNLQDPVPLDQYRRVNNPVFELDHIGVRV